MDSIIAKQLGQSKWLEGVCMHCQGNQKLWTKLKESNAYVWNSIFVYCHGYFVSKQAANWFLQKPGLLTADTFVTRNLGGFYGLESDLSEYITFIAK